jgi:hypothetical protein
VHAKAEIQVVEAASGQNRRSRRQGRSSAKGVKGTVKGGYRQARRLNAKAQVIRVAWFILWPRPLWIAWHQHQHPHTQRSPQATTQDATMQHVHRLRT